MKVKPAKGETGVSHPLFSKWRTVHNHPASPLEKMD